MKSNLILVMMFFLIILHTGCKKFLEIDPPKESLVQSTVFQNDEMATSALTGIYSAMASSGIANGGNSSFTAIGGLSADELIGYNANLKEFNDNQIMSTNSVLSNLYASPYSYIYTANAILEGLEASVKVSQPVKAQLRGEALFIRAFCYFYLVNLFGPVPLIVNTDYRINRIAKRAPVVDVYQQIISDLQTADVLLTNDYVTIERIRPNRSTVDALLARTYLYLKDWINAEKYASLIVDQKDKYELVGVDDIFVKNSLECIWQLMPSANANTQDGSLFILTSAPTFVSLNNSFSTSVFEQNDKRKTSWVRSFTNSTGTYFYPYKYKIKSSSTVSEYSMVFRLAEQYLIRGEARIQQGKLLAAIGDLDKIRERAGVTLIANTHQEYDRSELLQIVEKERRCELFSEWGHRWLDLKRWGKADQTLSSIKPDWIPVDSFYPIPDAEISRNPNIIQNEGYGSANVNNSSSIEANRL